MKLSSCLFILLPAVILTGMARAQGTEVGAAIGYAANSDRGLEPPFVGEIRVGNGVSYNFHVGQRLVNGRVASLHLELIAVGVPSIKLNSSNVLVPRSYGAIFITPGFKFKFFPGFFLTPYAAVGGGYGRFNAGNELINGLPNPGNNGSNHIVYNYGGGIEMKIFPFVSIKGEVRDFVSGNPEFNLPVSGSRQHTIIPSAGVLFRF